MASLKYLKARDQYKIDSQHEFNKTTTVAWSFGFTDFEVRFISTHLQEQLRLFQIFIHQLDKNTHSNFLLLHQEMVKFEASNYIFLNFIIYTMKGCNICAFRL